MENMEQVRTRLSLHGYVISLVTIWALCPYWAYRLQGTTANNYILGCIQRPYTGYRMIYRPPQANVLYATRQ